MAAASSAARWASAPVSTGPPPRGIAVVLRSELRQDPAPGGQVVSQPGQRGEIGHRARHGEPAPGPGQITRYLTIRYRITRYRITRPQLARCLITWCLITPYRLLQDRLP